LNINLPPSNQNKCWPWKIPDEVSDYNAGENYAWPRITIVTPSYNQGEFIEETIRSVLLQGYPNLEYIIMDGGSTDESVEIIKKYEPWLANWVSEKDRGQSHAINKGWQRSTGELVAWLNSDDYLAYGTLQRVARVYCQHQNSPIGLIYGQANVINPQGDLLFPIGEPFDLAYCLKNLIDPMPQPSVFITKKCLDEVGLLDESLHYAMDLDLFIRIALTYPPFFINETWSYVRYTPETKTSRNPMGFVKDQFKLLDKIFTHPLYKEKYRKLKGVAYASNYLRSARIHYESGGKMEAFHDLAHAIGFDTLFVIEKVVRTILFGRYRNLKNIKWKSL
jgi:glycosyltransferase involved in cell wall biosynthesis